MIKKVAKLLHIGQMTKALQRQLEGEGGIVWLEEGIPVTAVLRAFKAPGIRCGYRRMSFVGFVAMSKRRLVASASFFHKTEVNVAFEDPEFKAITFSVAGNRLSMSFEAAGLIPDASGEVTLRFATFDLPVAAQLLAERGGRIGEPDGAANRSQPIRPAVNRTSEAAGSGR
jgi:hypothetical protein